MDAARLTDDLIEQYVLAGSEHICLDKLRAFANHVCDRIRLRVAENPNAPRDVLRRLAVDPNNDIRVAVACNPSCEEGIILRLATDPDVAVRHGLAQRIDAPKPVLEHLAEDENGWVRAEALKSLELYAPRVADEVARQRQLRQNRISLRREECHKRAGLAEEAAS